MPLKLGRDSSGPLSEQNSIKVEDEFLTSDDSQSAFLPLLKQTSNPKFAIDTVK